jgi:hypothetical protein
LKEKIRHHQIQGEALGQILPVLGAIPAVLLLVVLLLLLVLPVLAVLLLGVYLLLKVCIVNMRSY